MNSHPPFIHDNDSAGKVRILTEALRLFARKGLSATSIRDIANTAGLSNPALYKHFKTKDELAHVLFERLYRSHLRSLQNEVRSENGFQKRFRAFLRCRLRAYDEQPAGVIFASDNFISLWPHMPKEMKDRTILTLLREIIEVGRSEGHVGTDAAITIQVMVVIGVLEQITRQMFFDTLSGSAVSLLDEVERILAKAMT